MNELQQILSGWKISKEQLEQISALFRTVTISKGEFFIRQGKINRDSGFLLRGVMRYFSYNAEGNDPTCFFISGKRYAIDPYHFHKGEPSTINLQAITDCELLAISLENERKLCTLFPEWTRITNELLLRESIDFAGQKELLMMNASERYLYFLQHYPEVAKAAPLKYVASYLGIAQPSLSRIRESITLGKLQEKKGQGVHFS